MNNTIKIAVPEYVSKALDVLKSSGAEGWLVGGCVRDAILGRTPHDFDIAVSTLPEETVRIFDGYTVIPTGLKHGTVTVHTGGHDLELTTFRKDGEYLDSRRPESVTFVSDIESDLSRRDFTINAAAWSPDKGLCDPFGAAGDASRKLIRCVGVPEERFGEDALRILRALRFASVLGFDIEENTDRAIQNMYRSLANISKERIREELVKTLCGKGAVEIFLKYKEIIGFLIPELSRCMGYDPGNDRHKYDVYEHCVRTAAGIDVSGRGVVRGHEVSLRLCGLLHDAGKPECAVTGADGRLHFPRHEAIGARIAGSVLRRLKFDNATIYRVTRVIARHDSYPKTNRNSVRRDIAEVGKDLWWDMEALRRADNSAKADGAYAGDKSYFETVENLAQDILDNGECVSPDGLKITGNDLLTLGVSGVVLGDVKRRIYDEVIDGRLKNEYDALYARAGELVKKAVTEN